MNVPTSSDSLEKRLYVREMFSRISQRYDLMNRLMSLGRDQSWRRFAARQARIPPDGQVLDVATGTGDLAQAILEVEPTARVVGADFALPMLDVARIKMNNRSGKPFELVGGDALQLPFPDATFDACLSGFVMRNVVDVAQAFAEQRRVVRPGGRVVCLEAVRPSTPLFRGVFELYFGCLVPFIGGLLSEGDAYAYLPASVFSFFSPSELASVMQQAGLRNVRYWRLALGTITVHVGTR